MFRIRRKQELWDGTWSWRGKEWKGREYNLERNPQKELTEEGSKHEKRYTKCKLQKGKVQAEPWWKWKNLEGVKWFSTVENAAKIVMIQPI